jgi:hypothetical protein
MTSDRLREAREALDSYRTGRSLERAVQPGLFDAELGRGPLNAPPSREHARAKAWRYLREGRLNVCSVHAGRVRAQCRGNGTTYDLGYTHRSWHCSCAARTPHCAHLLALRSAVSVDLSEPT